MKSIRRRKKWARVAVFSMCMIMISSVGILMSSVADIEPTRGDSRGSSESTWTQTTQTDFENGTSTDLIVTPTGEVKLGMMSMTVEDDFKDESKIGYRDNVIVDTIAGEARLEVVKDLLINKTFGGSTFDTGHTVQQTSDSGYVIAADTGSYGAGGGDVWLIKTDGSGNEQWNRTFGGIEGDYAMWVQQTSDDGYIVTGFTESYAAGEPNAWLIKTDSSGNEQWNKSFGGNDHDYGMSVRQTTDGGYIIGGFTGSYGAGSGDVWLIKTDNSGQEQWNRTFGGSRWDFGLTVQQTLDGGYVVSGCTASFVTSSVPLDYDMWLIKTDSLGIEQWNRSFGGDGQDLAPSVQQTSDSGYLIVGRTESYGAGNSDVWLVKTDNSGIEQWNRTFGGSERDEGQTARETFDGGYIIAGATRSFGAGQMDVWLIKTDSSGNEQWNRTFGGGLWDLSAFHDFGSAIQQISDYEYIIVGATESYGAGDWDVWLLKFNASGNPIGELISVNLLSGQDAYSIDTFDSIASIPIGTGIDVQFSNDGLVWVDSYGNVGQWNTLTDGLNSIDLSGLGWQGSVFYYRMSFTSNTNIPPVLQNVLVSYSMYLSYGTLESEPLDTGTYPIWKTLNWSATTSPETDIRFQLRSASSSGNLAMEDFVGPDGSGTTSYTTSGQSIWTGHERDRWLQYKAHLTTTVPSTTPNLEEVSIRYEPVDTDDDDIPDFEDSDDDNDGLPDSWESLYGLNPLISEASGDPDFDTLKNLQEFQSHTNPLDNDTDGDGLGDGFEIVFSKTIPTMLDTNGDGVGDGLEFVQSQGYMGIMVSRPNDWIGISIAWENHLVLVRTNSSVLEGGFDREEQRLRMRISGPDGSTGLTEIDIPNELCSPGDIEIRLDGQIIDYSLTQGSTHHLVSVEYTHSTHEMTADFGQAIVMPSGISDIWYYLVASMAAVITLLGAIAYVKQRRGREDIGVQELPPKKLSILLEKKNSEGKISNETYQDIKSLLKKYGEEGNSE